MLEFRTHSRRKNALPGAPSGLTCDRRLKTLPAKFHLNDNSGLPGSRPAQPFRLRVQPLEVCNRRLNCLQLSPERSDFPPNVIWHLSPALPALMNGSK